MKTTAEGIEAVELGQTLAALGWIAEGFPDTARVNQLADAAVAQA
jgi:hypothetical protein